MFACVCVCVYIYIYRTMEKNIFKSASADFKPLIKPKVKEERLVYWIVSKLNVTYS